MTLILLVIGWALATWFYCMWQAEKYRRKGIQRSHNSAVRRSMVYRQALSRLHYESQRAPDELMTLPEFIDFVRQYTGAALDGPITARSTDGGQEEGPKEEEAGSA